MRDLTEVGAAADVDGEITHAVRHNTSQLQQQQYNSFDLVAHCGL